MNSRFGIIVLLIVAAAMSRLLPHPYNFTPIGAIGLFGAAYFTKRYLAFLVPFAAMWVSDLILNNVVYAQYYTGFQWGGNTSVYVSFGLIIILGSVLLRKVNTKNVLMASVSASLLFYLITNFAVWMGSTTYPQNAVGLLSCYAAGLPFYSMELAPPFGFLLNGIAGDLFYCAALFGVFELLKARFPKLQEA
ncbi:MAG: DUF6580 family putative transport protein [Saprospiraceae bacterium]